MIRVQCYIDEQLSDALSEDAKNQGVLLVL